MQAPTSSPEYNRPSFVSEGPPNHRSRADFQHGLHVGMEALDFPLLDLEGQTVRLSEFRKGKHLVLEFGCITAPVFINDLSSLVRLQRRFQDRGVVFVIIYAREAHPGAHYPAHRSLDQKLAHARDLNRLEKVDVPILVDSLDGQAHRAYGLQPSPVYVVRKDSVVVYKASWLAPGELESLLEDMLESEDLKAKGERMTRQVYSERLLPVRTH